MKIEYELHFEPKHGMVGYDTYKNGEKVDWSAAGSATMVSMLRRNIQRDVSADEGGTITVIGYSGKDEVYEVDPCPTKHARISDDFMGGSVCLDCKAVW